MTKRHPKLFRSLLLALFITGIAVSPALAKDADYDAVVNHFKAHYQAKRQRIPLMGLARFAVKIARPAGVKSFDVAVLENLKFESPERRRELNGVLTALLKNGWTQVLRANSSNNNQSLVFASESGNDIKLLIVNVEADQAEVIRAKISPEKLVEFLQDPKVMGITLSS